jgi:hypothetical protein
LRGKCIDQYRSIYFIEHALFPPMACIDRHNNEVEKAKLPGLASARSNVAQHYNLHRKKQNDETVEHLGQRKL